MDSDWTKDPRFTALRKRMAVRRALSTPEQDKLRRELEATFKSSGLSGGVEERWGAVMKQLGDNYTPRELAEALHREFGPIVWGTDEEVRESFEEVMREMFPGMRWVN